MGVVAVTNSVSLFRSYIWGLRKSPGQSVVLMNGTHYELDFGQGSIYYWFPNAFTLMRRMMAYRGFWSSGITVNSVALKCLGIPCPQSIVTWIKSCRSHWRTFEGIITPYSYHGVAVSFLLDFWLLTLEGSESKNSLRHGSWKRYGDFVGTTSLRFVHSFLIYFDCTHSLVDLSAVCFVPGDAVSFKLPQ